MCTVDFCLSVSRSSYRISFLIQVQLLLYFRAMRNGFFSFFKSPLRRTPPSVRRLIHQTIFFIWIHESSARLKRKNLAPTQLPTTNCNARSPHPSLLHMTLKSFWINSEIRKPLSQQLTIIRYLYMNANLSANMRSRGVQFG